MSWISICFSLILSNFRVQNHLILTSPYPRLKFYSATQYITLEKPSITIKTNPEHELSPINNKQFFIQFLKPRLKDKNFERKFTSAVWFWSLFAVKMSNALRLRTSFAYTERINSYAVEKRNGTQWNEKEKKITCGEGKESSEI